MDSVTRHSCLKSYEAEEDHDNRGIVAEKIVWMELIAGPNKILADFIMIIC
jgi:hypothetical protein